MHKKILSVVIICAIALLAVPKDVVHAGAIGSSDTGGGSGGTSIGNFRTPLQWFVKRGVATGATIKDTHQSPHDAFTIQKNDSIAYVTTETYQIGGKNIKYPNNWYRWRHWMAEGLGDPGSGINPLLWDSTKLLPNEFITETKNSGFANQVKKAALYKRGKDYADLVWIRGAVIKKERTDTKTVIVKYENNKDKNSFDNSSKTNKWLYENPKTKVPYSYKSPENVYNFNHVLKATSKTVTKRTSWEEDSSGHKSNQKVTYSSSNTRTTTVRASWTADVPDLSYKPFKPMNLNTEKVASKSVISKGSIPYNDYRNGSVSEIDIDNKKGSGESAAGALQVLDTNTERAFKVRFKNGQFGIPNKSQGGIDVSKSKPAFKDSLNKVQIYWGAKIGVSSSNRSYTPALSSIEFAGKEYKGTTAISKDSGWKAGDFKFRSIKSGTYALGYNGEPFWYADLQTGIYFKYGGGYSGIITPGSKGPVFSSAKGDKISVGNNNRWVGSKSMGVKQPVLYGEFVVKTVGGYKK